MNKKSFINKSEKLGINKNKIFRDIKTVEDIKALEYACKKNLDDLKSLNLSRFKLEHVDYEYFYKYMCKFSIGLNKMDILKIPQENQKIFNDSFESIYSEFKDLEFINSVRSYNMD